MTAGVAARPGSADARTVASGLPDRGWDERLSALGGHFLQSRAWARCQQRMGSAVYHAEGEGWMWLGLIRRVGPFRRLYLPYGPQVRDASVLGGALRTAAAAAHAAGCVFVQYEPVGRDAIDPAVAGARRVRTRQPEYTWQIHLDVSEAELRAALSRGHRSRINAAPRKDVVVASGRDAGTVDEFLEQLHATHARARMPIHGDAYYRAIVDELTPTGEVRLYFARHAGRALAGAIVLDLGGTRYYAYAGSRDDPEARQRGPSPALVWQAILDARDEGRRLFDFWGVAPPDEPRHPWAGFTEFKRSFGGELLRRNGTWDLPVRPLPYAAWSLLQRLRR